VNRSVKSATPPTAHCGTQTAATSTPARFKISITRHNRQPWISRQPSYAQSPWQQELRATALPSETHSGNGALPTGQELLPALVAAVGAELAGSLAGPLLFLALLSTPSAQAVLVAWRGHLKESLQTFLREWANTVERREHLRLLGQVATAIAA